MLRKNGVVTTQLILVLVIIISLVFVSLESARVNSFNVLSERVSAAALNSVLAEFYRPLYDEYHIFALDASYGGKSVDTEAIKLRTSKYIEDNLSPAHNEVLLNNLQLKKLDITGYTALMADKGKYFYDQANSYQKFRVVAEVIEELMQLLGLMEETEEVKGVLLKQVETEDQLSKIDIDIQKLMTAVDGVEFEKYAVKTNRKKQIVTADSFTKRILNAEPSQANVGVNNYDIYSALKDKYVNMTDMVDSLISDAKAYDVINKSYIDQRAREAYIEGYMVSLWKQHDYIRKQYDKIEESLDGDISEEMEDELENELMEKLASIDEIYTMINDLGIELIDVRREIAVLEKASKAVIGSYNKTVSIISKTNTQCIAKCNEALGIIDDILALQVRLTPVVNDYANYFESSKKDIPISIYEDIETSVARAKEYISPNNENSCVNLSDAKEVLAVQLSMLTEIEGIDYRKLPELNTDGRHHMARLDVMKGTYMSYPSGRPIIDYTGFEIGKSTTNGFLDQISSFINNSLMELVIGDAKISEAKIAKGNLPSDTMSLYYASESSLGNIINMIKNSSFGSILNADSTSNVRQALTDVFVNILNKVLFITYVGDNFSDYFANDAISVLKYEREYVLNGKATDKDNLASMITKLLIVRLAFNFLYISTNRECKDKAFIAASAIVGFTGLPMLISIVKYLIIAVWAFESALVEVAALMMNKKVSFFVTGSRLAVGFEEILTMTKESINSKAKGMKSEKYGINYGLYVMLFMFLTSKDKLTFHSMDIMQENIRALYEDGFRMSNCIVSFKASAQYLLPEKFASILGPTDGYLYGVRMEKGYDRE